MFSRHALERIPRPVLAALLAAAALTASADGAQPPPPAFDPLDAAGIAQRLANGYLKNPKVSVEVLNFRPIYVHGEVKSGGEFAFKTGLKLRDAIAMAGGYTYRANQNYVYVSREGEQEVKVPMQNSMPVLPGDNVRIPERFF